MDPDALFNKLLTAAQQVDPDLHAWMIHREAALRGIVAAKVAAKASAEPQEQEPAEPEPKPTPFVPFVEPRSGRESGREPMDLFAALVWVERSMDQLAALPPPGPGRLHDDVGFSAATNGPGRRWLAHAQAAGGAGNLPLAYNVAAAEVLREHSETQLNRDEWQAAYDALKAAAPVDAETARAVLHTAPGSTAKRGETDKDGSWEATERGPIAIATPQRRAFKISYQTLQAAGFQPRVDVSAGKNAYGDFVWLVAPHAVERFAEWIAPHYPTLAAAMKTHAPVWVARAAATGAGAVAGGPTTPTTGPTAPTVQVPPSTPEEGNVQRVRWQWSPEDRRVLKLLLPGKDVAFAVDRAAKGQTAYKQGPMGMEYWRAFDTRDVGEIARVLDQHGLQDAAAALRRHAAVWQHVPEVPAAVREERERRARMMTRRFRHMLHPDLKADPTAAEQVIAESMDLLNKVQIGTAEADLGAWGAWRLVDERGATNPAGNEIRIYTPYSMKGWEDHVKGARMRKDERGWHVTSDVRRVPAIARALDKVDPPLAMSLRLGLLTELLGADRDCPALEELASARTVTDIVDVKAAARVRQINDAIRWPSGLAPFPFQRVGIAYAVIAERRALIGDSMGLGKTIQAIGTLLYDVAKSTPALVACPKSVVGNWRDEIKRWAPSLTPILVSSRTLLPPAQPGVVAIVSWGTLPRIYERLLEVGFKTVIYDESHYVKNGTSQRGEAARILAHAAEGRLLLSGTAMENRPIELWHQLHCIDPVQFGDKTEFGQRFAAATQRTVKTPTGVRTFWDDRGASNLDELRDLLRCYMIRRLKSEVMTELPEKTRTAVWVDLDPGAAGAYKNVADNVDKAICAAWKARSVKAARKLIDSGTAADVAIRQVNDEAPNAAALAQMAIVELGYLRRAVAEAKIPQAIEWVMDFLESGNPLVIFIEHQSALEALGTALNEAKVPWSFIDGSVAALERTRRVTDFQEGRIQVIVGSQAMHAGVTLTRAADMLFVERWWVPSREEQAEDRIYRIGQKNAVNIRYLMAHGTVDEHIAELVDKKRQVIEKVMGGEKVNAAAVSEEIAGAQSDSLAMALVRKIAARLQAGGLCRIDATDLC